MRPLTGIAARTIAVLAVSAAAHPSFGQSPEQTPTPRFVDVVDVEVVNVEVFVTDRDGRPIVGLTRDDFVLLEDGEPVPITNFYAATGVRPAAPGTAEAEGAPADTALPPETQRLHLLVHLDQDSIRPFGRKELFAELRRFLTTGLGAGARVMLVTHEGVPQVRQPFTDDMDQVVAAVDRLEVTAGGVAATDAEASMLQRVMASAPPPGSTADDFAIEDARSILQQIQSHAGAVRERTRARLSALRAFLAAVAGVPGRKAVLYVGEGLQTRPAEALFQEWELRFPELARSLHFNAGLETNRYAVGDELGLLIDQANASRITFYTLDTAEHRSFSRLSAEVRDSGGDLPGLVPAGANREDSLVQLAAGTGGVHALAAGAAAAGGFATLARDLDSYYSLGFEPSSADDERDHRLEVEVARQGARVRFRDSYRPRGAEQRVRDAVTAAVHFGGGDNPLAVEAAVETARPGPDGGFEVPLVVKVPIGNLALLPSESIHEATVGVYLVVRDARGMVSRIQRHDFPVRIPNDRLLTALGQVAAFTFNLVMDPGPQRVAVGVRDQLAAQTSIVTLDLDIGNGE